MGKPTFFVTISAAETDWAGLLKALKQTVDKEDVTHEEARALEWATKCRLIKSDPVSEHYSSSVHFTQVHLSSVHFTHISSVHTLVLDVQVTCARHFNHLTHTLVETVLKVGRYGPLGVVSDFTIRVEFQQRGLLAAKF